MKVSINIIAISLKGVSLNLTKQTWKPQERGKHQIIGRNKSKIKIMSSKPNESQTPTNTTISGWKNANNVVNRENILGQRNDNTVGTLDRGGTKRNNNEVAVEKDVITRDLVH